jgi:hypothetical protein
LTFPRLAGSRNQVLSFLQSPDRTDVRVFLERAISQLADEDFEGELSAFPEDAHDHALGWYEMMRSLRQTMLNLLAAGLFHLIEQQLAALGHDGRFRSGPPTKWLRVHSCKDCCLPHRPVLHF